MKNMKPLGISVLIVYLITSAAFAAPQKVNFQGKLTDAAGNPVNASVSMTFKIWDALTGGNALWTETQTVTVTNGIYNVLLGASNAIDTELTETKALWLGVKVGADAEMSPRVALTPGMYDMIMLNTITIKNGNIGIGTANPALAKLVVNEGVGNTAAIFGNSLPLAAVFSHPNLGFNTYYNNGWKVFTGGKYTGAIGFNPNTGEIGFRTGNAPANDGDSVTLIERVTIKQNGSIGIGTNDFSGFRSGLNPRFYIKDSGWVGAFIESDSYGAILGLKNSERSFEIASRGNSLQIHDITTGQLRVSLDANGKFNIYGTLYVSGGADLAEPFDMTDIASLELGDVVVMDPANPKHLTKSLIAYDHKVAGIVSSSEQAGYVAGGRSDGSSDKPIALSGRVLCKVSAENGAIVVGDLLTTSNTPGYAMKATDRDKAFGAVLGKALEAFNGDKGQILVLVALQ